MAVDWARNAVLAALFGWFVREVFLSVQRLRDRQIGLTEDSANSAELLYPSITICPMDLTTMSGGNSAAAGGMSSSSGIDAAKASCTAFPGANAGGRSMNATEMMMLKSRSGNGTNGNMTANRLNSGGGGGGTPNATGSPMNRTTPAGVSSLPNATTTSPGTTPSQSNQVDIKTRLKELKVDTIRHFYYKDGNITRFAASGSDIGNLSFVHWNYLSVGPVRCFTYDPPDVSPTGMDYKVEIELSLKVYSFYWVHLHFRNHFGPGTGKLFGSSVVMSNSPRLPIDGNAQILSAYEIRMTDATYLDEGRDRCVSDGDDESVRPTNNWNKCITDYAQKTLKCSLPWMENKKFADCTSSDQISHLFNELTVMSERKIFERTGCMPSCRRKVILPDGRACMAFTIHLKKHEFEATLASSKEVTLACLNNSMSVLNLYYAGTRYSTRKQYLTYTADDFLSSVGGYLGLLLGYSLLSIYDIGKEVVTWVSKWSRKHSS